MQSSGGVLQKKFRSNHRERPVLESLLKRDSNTRFFPLNIAKLFKNTYFKEICEGLLLMALRIATTFSLTCAKANARSNTTINYLPAQKITWLHQAEVNSSVFFLRSLRSMKDVFMTKCINILIKFFLNTNPVFAEVMIRNMSTSDG